MNDDDDDDDDDSEDVDEGSDDDEGRPDRQTVESPWQRIKHLAAPQPHLNPRAISQPSKWDLRGKLFFEHQSGQ